MGMQAKAWSSAELKKKTIKDVNDAIESGEIEAGGGDSYWTKVTYDGKDYLAQIGTESFTTPNFVWGMSGSWQALNIVYNNTAYPIITLFTNEITYERVRSISPTNKGTGSAGQLLGKDSNNTLNWITPKLLYRHVVFILPTTSAPTELSGMVEIFNNSNTPINSVVLLQQAIAGASAYGHELPFNGCLHTGATAGESLHKIYASSSALRVSTHNAGTTYSLLSGYQITDDILQLL